MKLYGNNGIMNIKLKLKRTKGKSLNTFEFSAPRNWKIKPFSKSKINNNEKKSICWT